MEEYASRYQNTFTKEPTKNCPRCNALCRTEWVDNGFGPYSVQADPYHCDECGWIETGCPAKECIKEQCFSWAVCGGRAILPEEDNGGQCATRIKE